jgi:hypothetical protein
VTTSPFSTALQAIPGLNNYAQYDAAETKTDHFGSFSGYGNTVGGGIMNPAGSGFQQAGWGPVPNSATSAQGVPLDGIAGDINLAMQNRPTSIPGGPAGQLYASIGFRAQPEPEAPADPQNELTPFWGGAWVRSFANVHAALPSYAGDDLNQVIISRRPFVGNGSGEGIDNIPGEDGWHLFMRNDDGTYGGTGKLSWQMGDGTNLINFESTADLWADNWWHFVAFNYNGDPTDSNALSLYVDGSPVATTRTVTGDAASMFIVSSGGQWQVAVGNSGGKNNIWDGPIDESFVGFGELTAADVANLWTLADLAAPGVPGDADGDGDVDADDAQVVAANYGQLVGVGGPASGDHDGTGRVNLLDWDIMAINYGVGVGPDGVSALPEPASLAMLVIGGLAAFRRRTDRRL